MDGVIYRENHLITGAVEFVDAMLATGTPFLFLTNNSAPTAEDLAVKLKHLGIRELHPRHFYTSALNTADFLSETHPNCTAFAIGKAAWPRPCTKRKSRTMPLVPTTSWWVKARQQPTSWPKPTNSSSAARGW